MEYRRPYFEVLARRLEEKRAFIQVLAGPRQVGKTTLALQLQKAISGPSHYASADGVPGGSPWIEQQWEVARIRRQQSGEGAFYLFLDEIQKINNWSEVIKRLWDEDTAAQRSIKVVLLGSSRLLLQQGLMESLAGRFELTYIPHWSFSEMQDAFGWDLEKYIWFGGYPGAAALAGEEQRWRQYVRDAIVETSISKDVLMLTRVDKPALMRHLFDLGCAYSGQILSYNKMIGQLQDAGNATTLSHYLNLLGQAGLLTGLEKYSGNLITQRGSSPKFQVHNTAFLASVSPLDLPSVRLRPDLWGRQVESSIGAHLLNHSLSGDFKLYYWREGKFEVDFVLEKHGRCIGLEIKSNAKTQTAGMGAFQQQFHPERLLLVGESGLPLDVFFKMNPGELF